MASDDYLERGYRLVPGLLAPEICKAFMAELQAALDRPQQPITRFRRSSNLLNGDSVEVYGYEYPPMISFLWGLTPAMRDLAGCELLPTYSYFRLYREGDICRVHSDRYACEHSLSLTLDYSDGVPWPLEVGSERVEPSAKVEADFGEELYASLEMRPGDAVLYQGVHHRHGRVAPNPNGWSAHLFLHWVDRNGPYREHAFDGSGPPARAVNFAL